MERVHERSRLSAGRAAREGDERSEADGRRRLAVEVAGTDVNVPNKQKEIDRALRQVSQAIDRYPHVPSYHLLQGRIFLETHRLEQALKAFDQSIETANERAESLPGTFPPAGELAGAGNGTAAPSSLPLPLLDQFPGAVLLLDAAGRVTHANGIAELRLDALAAELIGRDLFRQVLPQLEETGWGERYRAAMSAGRAAFACEAVSGAKHLEIGVRSFIHAGTLGAFALVDDRTSLRLEENRRRRAEYLAAIGQLAGSVAHEINNPLASIKGFAQLLGRDANDPEQAQALEIISHECSRVATIIDNLLSFAEQQRQRTRESVDLNELVEEMLRLRRYSLETSGIAVEFDLDPDLPRISGERGAIQRALLVLIGRAERVLDGAGEAPRLLVRTRESSDGVVVSLVDNGPAIPRTELPRIFSSAEADETPGWLGLGVAQAVAQEHGGHLAADSVVDRGTAFHLRLPLAEPFVPHPVLRAPRPVVRSLPDRPLRVLVADDEPSLRLAIALFLGRHGHEVVQAVDTYEAQRACAQRSFDVVLADAALPGDMGELLRRLDDSPAMRGRAILLTDGGPPRGGWLEQRPHLAKPFDMTEVIRMVESVAR